MFALALLRGARQLSLGTFRSGAFAWDRSLGVRRLGSFAWELSLWILNTSTSTSPTPHPPPWVAGLAGWLMIDDD